MHPKFVLLPPTISSFLFAPPTSGIKPVFHQHIIPPHSSSYQSLVYLDAQVWNFWVYSSVEAPLVCDGYMITKICLFKITAFSQRMLMVTWTSLTGWPEYLDLHCSQNCHALFTSHNYSYLLCFCLFPCSLPPLYPSLNPVSILPFSIPVLTRQSYFQTMWVLGQTQPMHSLVKPHGKREQKVQESGC